jgi:hypothetical protein
VVDISLYLAWDTVVVEKAVLCLDACLTHVLNLLDEQLGRGQMCVSHSMMFYVCLAKKILIGGAGVAM